MTVAGPPRAPRPVFTLPVEDDPLPWLTEQFRAAGVFETDRPEDLLDPTLRDVLSRIGGGKAPRVVSTTNTPTLRAMGAALRTTSSIVTALSDHEKRFGVRFSPTAKTASTYLKAREVVIGIKPMLDPRLTDGQRAALMVALAYHEVGHVIWTADMQNRVAIRYGATNKPVHKVFNIIHDLLLEAQQAKEYPGYAPTLRVKQAYWGKAWKVRFNSRANRLGAMVQATLYPQGTDWNVSPEAQEWFAWATDWAERCRDIKAGKSPTYLFRLIDEGIERLRLDDKDEPDPIKEDEERPETDDTEEEDGDEPTFDPDDGDEDGDMDDDPLGDDPTGDGDEPPIFEPQDEEDDDDDPLGDDPTDDSTDEDEEQDEDDPKGTPTGSDTDEDDESDEEDDDEDGPSTEDDSEDESEDGDSEEEDADSDKDGDPDSHEEPETARDDDPSTPEEEPAEPDSDLDDKEVPQAHPEDDEDAEAWQGAIDDFERVQVSGRDKVVVGGGAWSKREARIIRIK